jgi:beta-xylosidase
MSPEAGAADWRAWKKQFAPVWSGDVIAADPSVIKVGSTFYMSYTCLNTANNNTEICQAKSQDGYNWTHVNFNAPIRGLILEPNATGWDPRHETAAAIPYNGMFYQFFAGIPTLNGMQGKIGRAVSSQPSSGYAKDANPVLAPTPGDYDNDSALSPAFTVESNYLAMVYAGHCYTNCQGFSPGVRILGAWSKDTVNWTKIDRPLLEASGTGYMESGVGEPSIMRGPDGYYYLFFTGGLGQGQKQSIGIARSAAWNGPYMYSPQPIIAAGTGSAFDSKGVLAPTVMYDSVRNVVRMWFFGANAASVLAVGYAEAAWPLWIGGRHR